MAEFERALQLDPNDAGSRSALSFLKAQKSGRLDEMIRSDQQASAQDPLSTTRLDNLSGSLYLAGRYEEAIELTRKAMQLSPSIAYHHASLGYSLMMLGRHQEALSEFLKEPRILSKLAGLSSVYWSMGRRMEADATLKKLEESGDLTTGIACIHAYRGERDAAFEWLDRAYRAHDPEMVSVALSPMLRNLHNDPRYRALLVKLKLAE